MHILLIARHYPPEVSGGARRPSLFAKAIRRAGHRVTLVTPFAIEDPDHVHIQSDNIDRGFEGRTSTAPTSTRPPMAGLIAWIKTQLRTWAFWPDPDIRWVRKVVRQLKQNELRPDWIMTTSPPESSHYIGFKLASYFNCKWVAECRDTWTLNPHRQILEKSRFRVYLERKIARRWLSQADVITAVSETVMSEIRNYAAKDVSEIIIGHFSDPPPLAITLASDEFHLVHTGAISLSDRRRSISPVLDIMKANKRGMHQLRLHLAGRLTLDEIELVNSSGVNVTLYGSISLSQSRALQAAADALLLLTPEQSHALPGKYAEYITTGRPIVYHGGGDWLELVDPKIELLDLQTGLEELKKGQRVSVNRNSAHAAANALLEGLTSSALRT